MALTAAQKKAIADAQALIAKNKATVAKLEAAQASAAKKSAAAEKATAIAAQEEERITSLNAAKTAPAKTQAQVDAINAGVQAATEASGNVYDPLKAMTVENQVSINPNVKTTQNYATGSLVDTFTPAGGKKTTPDGLSETDKDAYALLKETFTNYGLEELIPAIEKLMSNNVGPNQASLMLKTNPEYNGAYIKRFAGNEARRKAGLNALSEAEYLDLENSYSSTLTAFGLKNYFGSTTEAKRTAMANIIGSDISATEFKDRVDTVVTRVNNADPKIKETLKSFYNIKEEDLTSYFLNPTDNLPKLQEKVTAAEIGAAAANQNLAYGKTTAEDLAKFGITKAQAQEGYSTIGEIMPTATKLGAIYNENYDQATAEAEVFKGTASAKRKRQQLAEREVASFSGSSGRLRTGQQQGNTGKF